MERTSKPTVAGILSIISGILGLIVTIRLIGIAVTSGAMNIPGTEAVPEYVSILIWITTIPSLSIGVLALIGGIFAVQRKKWQWALAGSIAAVFAFLPLGIAAVILTAQARNEFE